jgi:hypothetical protein
MKKPTYCLTGRDWRDPLYWRDWMELLAEVPRNSPPARHWNYVVYLAKNKSLRHTPLTPKNIAVIVKRAEPLAIIRLAIDYDGSPHTDTFFHICRWHRPGHFTRRICREYYYGLWGGRLFRRILKYAGDVLGAPANFTRLYPGFARLYPECHKKAQKSSLPYNRKRI